MIGILKSELANTDRNFFAIDALNKLTKTDTVATLFCDYSGQSFILPIETNLLQRAHAFHFDGILITDDLVRSQDLIYATYAKKRFLYCYHFDWPYINQPRFSYLNTLLLNENIELIARTEHHAKLIEQLFKKPKYIMEEWDPNVLIEIDNNE